MSLIRSARSNSTKAIKQCSLFILILVISSKAAAFSFRSTFGVFEQEDGFSCTGSGGFGGFFVPVLPRPPISIQIPPPPLISEEQRQAIEEAREAERLMCLAEVDKFEAACGETNARATGLCATVAGLLGGAAGSVTSGTGVILGAFVGLGCVDANIEGGDICARTVNQRREACE